MKKVTVTVQIQMDVNTRQDILPQVKDTLEWMNSTISASEIDAQPQIFVSDITDLDILEEGNQMCQKYTDSEALPDEDDKCSLCGGDCVDSE
jgi:hypothetical protein